MLRSLSFLDASWVSHGRGTSPRTHGTKVDSLASLELDVLAVRHRDGEIALGADVGLCGSPDPVSIVSHADPAPYGQRNRAERTSCLPSCTFHLFTYSKLSWLRTFAVSGPSVRPATSTPSRMKARVTPCTSNRQDDRSATRARNSR